MFHDGGSSREQHCNNMDDLSLEEKRKHKPEGHFEKLYNSQCMG